MVTFAGVPGRELPSLAFEIARGPSALLTLASPALASLAASLPASLLALAPAPASDAAGASSSCYPHATCPANNTAHPTAKASPLHEPP